MFILSQWQQSLMLTERTHIRLDEGHQLCCPKKHLHPMIPISMSLTKCVWSSLRSCSVSRAILLEGTFVCNPFKNLPFCWRASSTDHHICSTETQIASYYDVIMWDLTARMILRNVVQYIIIIIAILLLLLLDNIYYQTVELKDTKLWTWHHLETLFSLQFYQDKSNK